MLGSEKVLHFLLSTDQQVRRTHSEWQHLSMWHLVSFCLIDRNMIEFNRISDKNIARLEGRDIKGSKGSMQMARTQGRVGQVVYAKYGRTCYQTNMYILLILCVFL